MSTQPTVLFSREVIEARVRELGAEIGRAFSGHELCVVGVMKNGLVFMADLIRTIPLEMTCHFLQTSWLRESDADAARTDIVYSAEVPFAGRHVLLVVDIVDTGITLSFLLDHIREQGPASLKVCALIDKPGQRKVDVHPDWAAFELATLPAGFIIGYGLDFQERHRGLPFLGTMELPARTPGGREVMPASGGNVLGG